MNRRDFIKFIGAGSALLFAPGARAYYDEIASWRTFRLNYEVSLPEKSSDAKIWLPIPEINDTVYQRNMGSVWSNGPAKANLYARESAPLFFGEWRGKGPRKVTVGTMIKTADRHVKLLPETGPLPADTLHYLSSADTSGIVKKTAEAISAGALGRIAKAQKIYDWVIEKTFWDDSSQGCGSGNAAKMLASGNFGGKSLDIASLFVALARESDIPAREVVGILLDESPSGASIATDYHVRAEFYSPGTGWVPVDPAEIQRRIKADGLSPQSPEIASLKKGNFGNWKMNWIGLNHDRNVSLPLLPGTVPHFIYPYAEIGGKVLAASDFEFQIQVNEMVGTGVHFTFKGA